jgi:CDP-diacylglycerol--serine O-phosphatidyltransferase
MLVVIGALAAFLTTDPWATLLAVGAIYIGSFALSIRSYNRLRRAAEELRAGVHHDGEVEPTSGVPH